MSETVKIEGMDELVSKLEQMGMEGDRAVDTALAEGAIISRKAMRKKVYAVLKKRTGNLGENINIGDIRDGKKGKSIVVGVGKGDISVAYYGKFSEYGTSKEPAKPWQRPAFEESRDEVANKMMEVFGDAVEKYFKG